MKNIIELQTRLEKLSPGELDQNILLEAKQTGFADKQIAACVKSTEGAIRDLRIEKGINNLLL